MNTSPYSLSIFLLLPALFFASYCMAGEGREPDNRRTDTELLISGICSHCGQNHTQKAGFMQSEGSLIRRYNPIRLTLSGLMFVYQRFISPQLPSSCLFDTSCSHFSKELISHYGTGLGVMATADRLSRCNRVAVLDVHPLQINPLSGRIRESVDIYRLRKPLQP